MRKGKFSDEQIIGILKEAEAGGTAKEVVKKSGRPRAAPMGSGLRPRPVRSQRAAGLPDPRAVARGRQPGPTAHVPRRAPARRLPRLPGRGHAPAQAAPLHPSTPSQHHHTGTRSTHAMRGLNSGTGSLPRSGIRLPAPQREREVSITAMAVQAAEVDGRPPGHRSPHSDMWERTIAAEHLACDAEYLCRSCGKTRDRVECSCGTAEADQCIVRLAPYFTAACPIGRHQLAPRRPRTARARSG
jgi:hypothetical protein